MKKNILTYSILLVSIALVWGGCKQVDEKFISEGTIEYDAKVVDESNPMASLTPNKMFVKFKNNKSSVEMNAGMGLFSTSFVSNPENQTLIQLVKLLNKKYYLIQNIAEINKENEAYSFEITKVNETKVISGYPCKKASVHCKTGEIPDFDVFYTKDLDIKNPNFANPFQEIDGVLMEYQMKKFGLEMKFTAKMVTKESIDDAIFEVPADYKKISPKEMNELFLGLQ